jgi:hypothetical protein
MKLRELIEKAVKENGSMQNVADKLNVRFVTIHRWKTEQSFPTIENAHQLAILADLDPAQVITDILIQTEKRQEVKSTLERIKSILSAAAGVIPALMLYVQYCILCKIEPVRYDRIQSWN